MRLVLFVAEILDGLVVQQAFDRLGIGLGVGLVHLAAKARAPFRDHQRVGQVQGDRRAGGQGKPAVEHFPQHRTDQADFEQRGQHVEQQEGQQGLDALGAALDGARQAAGLARQVKAQRQRVQVQEDLQAHRADGVLADAGEHGVAQLGKQQRQHPCGAVGQDQPQRHRDGAGRAAAELVDRRLVKNRYIDDGRLGRQQAQNGDDDPGLQAGAVGGPEKGRQRAQGVQAVTPGRRRRGGGHQGQGRRSGKPGRKQAFTLALWATGLSSARMSCKSVRFFIPSDSSTPGRVLWRKYRY
ncbi:Uncharacterised protein [Bordetella pertussis]|nr:Uncharacterised protein [Bordetella pertussis]